MTSQSSTTGQTIMFLQLDFKAGYIIYTMLQTKKPLEHSVWHYRKSSSKIVTYEILGKS